MKKKASERSKPPTDTRLSVCRSARSAGSTQTGRQGRKPCVGLVLQAGLGRPEALRRRSNRLHLDRRQHQELGRALRVAEDHRLLQGLGAGRDPVGRDPAACCLPLARPVIVAASPALVLARASRARRRLPCNARDPRLRASGRGVSPRSERSGVKFAMIYLCCAGITIALPHR